MSIQLVCVTGLMVAWVLVCIGYGIGVRLAERKWQEQLSQERLGEWCAIGHTGKVIFRMYERREIEDEATEKYKKTVEKEM